MSVTYCSLKQATSAPWTAVPCQLLLAVFKNRETLSVQMEGLKPSKITSWSFRNTHSCSKQTLREETRKAFDLNEKDKV